MKLVRCVFTLSCWCILWAAAFAQEEAVRLQKANERIDEFVGQFMKENGTPGLALAVTNRDGLLRVGTYGWADLKARKPVQPNTVFQIGSISKSFTGIALLQLREEGKLDLHAPVSQYLAWFKIKNRFESLTPHHLLTHTAGLPRDRDDLPSSLFQAIALRDRTVAYAPGKHYAYSNVGYQTLGCVVESAAEQPYAEVIQQRIFAPLGMNASHAAITNALRSRMAVGYVSAFDDRPTTRDDPLAEATWIEYCGGDGSIASTPGDLAAYLRMLLNQGQGPKGRLLSEESFKLLTNRAVKGDDESHYSYGLDISTYEGRTHIGHAGAMLGYYSQLLGDLDDGVGTVVFVNGPGDPYEVAEFVLRCVRAAIRKQDLPVLPTVEPPTRVANGYEYTGKYNGPNGRQLYLQTDGDKLVLVHGGKRIPLETWDTDRFLVRHPDFSLFLLEFGREGDEVVEAFHGGDWYVHEKRYSGPKEFPHPEEWASYVGHYRAQHPWFNNFRVVLRKGKLWFVAPDGTEMDTELKPLRQKGMFQIGAERTAERLRFDTVINGRAQRANYSGVDYYRFFTP